MKITGLTLRQFQACTSFISHERYHGNVIMHPDAHDRPAQRSRETGRLRNLCVARLTVRDSHGVGSRLTASGRHGPYACWHAYRDVLREVFRQFPDAIVISGNHWQVTYRGQAGFEELYPATGRRNIGSPAAPVTMPELCPCDLIGRGEPVTTADLEIPEPLAASLDLTERLTARDITELTGFEELYPATGRFTASDILAGYHNELAPLASFDLGDPYWDNNPDHVSPQVSRASRAYAASARLLSNDRDISHGDKSADPLVFGPEDGGAARA